MDENKLQQIQDEIMREMDRETNLEASIISISKEIAAKLSLGGSVTEEIDGRPLVFNHRQYMQGKQPKIFMTVASPFMYEVGREKYKPYMVDVEVSNDFTLQENLASTVEAFLRHIFDMVKVEELGE